MAWIEAAGLGVALAVGLGFAAVLVARRRWRVTIESLRRDVMAGHLPVTPLPAETIPPVVATYLARAVPGSDRRIRAARLVQQGSFQMGQGHEGWKPFSAEEAFRIHPPAFYWDARISIAPGVQVLVRDSYVGGSARMVGKVAGLVRVVDEASSPELASGAMARYLAESVWFPARLAMAPGLSWRPVDDSSAVATLTDGQVTASLTFTFDREGDPVRVEGMRMRATDSGFESTPWVGTFAEHAEVDGFRIPLHGEVGWVIDGGLVPYWRGRIRTAEYVT